jgi:hypothetical protein
MNEYQLDLVNKSRKLSVKRIVSRVILSLLFPVCISLGYLFGYGVGHWLDFWMILYLFLNMVNGVNYWVTICMCRFSLWISDALAPLLTGPDILEFKGKAERYLISVKYSISSLLVKLLKLGGLGYDVRLDVFEGLCDFVLFVVLVSVGYVWTGVFFLIFSFLSDLGADRFRKMLYENVYRLEDSLGGVSDLDDLSDKLFNGGK